MHDLDLGLVETVGCWNVESPELTVDQVVRLSEEIIKLIGMTLDGPPNVSYYPNREGKGGYGIQMYQKLVESFLVISTWPDHGFARFYLASCMTYDSDIVGRFLTQEVGVIKASGGCTI